MPPRRTSIHARWSIRPIRSVDFVRMIGSFLMLRSVCSVRPSLARRRGGRRRWAAVVALLGLVLTGCSSTPHTGTASGPTAANSAGSSASAPSGATPSAGPSVHSSSGPTQTTPAGGCPIFPADNIWHADVSRLPVLASSAAYVASIGTSAKVHADFGAGNYGGGPIGIPVTTVATGQPGVKVAFDYADESDPGPYPIPAGAKIEGGPSSSGDRHVILFDPARCRSYELYAARPESNGTWHAGSGAIFDLRADAMRPRGWTSADAAGLSILAGLVRYDEVAAGRIDHAIRMTAQTTRRAYVWPATHFASDSSSASLPPMGLRLRLKFNVDISRLPTQARIVAQAMKTYGVILADNGSPWFLSGEPDNRWSNDALHALGGLTGANFEAVDVSGLMISSTSAACRPSP
jgi:hypothetical protein